MNMNMGALPHSGSETDPLSWFMWLAQMLITWLFATGFITYYQRAWHLAYEKYRDNHVVAYWIRAGMLVVAITVGVGLHMVGWMVFTDATGLMFHNLGLFALTMPLLDEDSSLLEYAIKVAAVVEVWLMHHEGYYSDPQFTISMIALAIAVVILRVFSDRIRNTIWPHIAAYGFVGVAFWTLLPKYSAGLHMTPEIAFQALCMYMGMTIVTAMFMNNEYKERVHNAAVAQEAHFDALTNAKSYAVYRQDIQSKFDEAKETHVPLAMAVIDIDHFKQVNDHYGHLAGDEVLAGVAATLEDVLTRYPGDLQLYRTGGEEFNVVLLGMSAEAVKPIMLDCWRAVRSRHFRASGQDVVATVSIGVSELKASDKKFDTLYARADDSLYRSKHRGRDTVTILSDTLDVEKERRIYATGTLYTRHVLDVAFKKPRVIHDDVRLANYEFATDRWNFAADFEIALDTQFAFISNVLTVSPHHDFSIRLSSRQFLDPDTPRRIGHFIHSEKNLRSLVVNLYRLPEAVEMSQATREYRLYGIQVGLTIHNPDKQIETVRTMAPYLDELCFRLDELRAAYPRDKVEQRMLEWSGIATSADARLIVGGVENQQDVDYALHDLHVHYLHGYYFDRPELPRFS